MRFFTALLVLACLAPVLAVPGRGYTTPEITPRFAQQEPNNGGCGKPFGGNKPACQQAFDAIKKDELAMLENGLPGHNGQGENPFSNDPNAAGYEGEKKDCSGRRTPEEEALGLNPGASPCEIQNAKKMMCKSEDECEANLVVEEENSEAERAELQEMALNKQVATLERLISHAKDIQMAIPSKMTQLMLLKRKLAAAAAIAEAKKADGELERQRAFLLELNNKITEYKEKLEELEMTKERTEKTIKELEEQANGLAPADAVVGEESGPANEGSEAASASGSGSASASGSGSASASGAGEEGAFI